MGKDLIRDNKDYTDKMKSNIIKNEQSMLAEHHLIEDMNSISEEELDEKFNEVFENPENKKLIDWIKKYKIVINKFNRGYRYDDVDQESRERKLKFYSLEDVVYFSEKAQEKLKKYDLR